MISLTARCSRPVMENFCHPEFGQEGLKFVGMDVSGKYRSFPAEVFAVMGTPLLPPLRPLDPLRPLRRDNDMDSFGIRLVVREDGHVEKRGLLEHPGGGQLAGLRLVQEDRERRMAERLRRLKEEAEHTDRVRLITAGLDLALEVRGWTWGSQGTRLPDSERDPPFLSEAGAGIFSQVYQTHHDHRFSGGEHAMLVAEEDLVRDCLYLLMGVPSKVFLYRPDTRTFTLASPIRTHSSGSKATAHVLARFVDTAGKIRKLEFFLFWALGAE